MTVNCKCNYLYLKILIIKILNYNYLIIKHINYKYIFNYLLLVI